jgi:hypothetical protein
MCSSIDCFWNAVENWCRTSPKPLIRVEASEGNWPVVRTGTVSDFFRGSSIDFVWEGDSEPHPLDLGGCAFRTLIIPVSLAEADVVRRFNLVCEESDDSTTWFVFTELRDFGKSN